MDQKKKATFSSSSMLSSSLLAAPPSPAFPIHSSTVAAAVTNSGGTNGGGGGSARQGGSGGGSIGGRQRDFLLVLTAIVSTVNFCSMLLLPRRYGALDDAAVESSFSPPSYSASDAIFGPARQKGASSSSSSSSSSLSLSSAVPPPYPYLNLGFPKSGSTSLHHYFQCGQIRSTHLWPCGGRKGPGNGGRGACGTCMRDALLRAKPVLDWCGYPYNFVAYTQLDKDLDDEHGPCFFPQVELLDVFHAEAPNATFVLPLRNTTDWIRSINRWMSMRRRLIQCNITGFPKGVGSDDADMERWYTEHVRRVRRFVEEHPTHRLVQFDVASSDAGSVLERHFGIPASCWGQSNESNSSLAQMRADAAERKRKKKEKRRKKRMEDEKAKAPHDWASLEHMSCARRDETDDEQYYDDDNNNNNGNYTAKKGNHSSNSYWRQWQRQRQMQQAQRGRLNSENAYFIMIGPIDSRGRYLPWLRSAVAIRNALTLHGSTADLVLLLAVSASANDDDDDDDEGFLLPSEERLLERHNIRYRYVPAPYDNPGFHMGHYKLYAWQHTEYKAAQLLDADVMPLVNMDRYFDLVDLTSSDFVGCPGKLSVLNAGWFVMRPNCTHFERMTDMLREDKTNASYWSNERGWGHELPFWINAYDRRQKSGWGFFDGHGNQGHLFSYFLHDAKDLTFLYRNKVIAFRNGTVSGDENLLSDSSSLSKSAKRSLKHIAYDAYPCPFPPVEKRASWHFTGNVKPWTEYNMAMPGAKDWYRYVEASGEISLTRDIFPNSSHVK